MVAFTNHCALLIQKHVKRFLQQRKYLSLVSKKRKVAALVRGFKTRRLIKLSQLREVILSTTNRKDRQFYI